MKRKINIDRKDISREKVKGYRNFNQILDKHRSFTKKPTYKNPKFIIGFAAVAALSYIFSLNTEEQQEQASFIEPAFEELNIPHQYFMVDPAKGDTLRHPSGSMIIIPPDAFADSSGSTVKENVLIRYREMKDPVDFFLSGIPMKYDSAGSEFHFESAGMIDISGSSNGEEVRIREGKSLEIHLSSAYDGDYNLYYLDTSAKKWTYEGSDRVEYPLSLTDENNERKLVQINKADTSNYRFDIAFSKDEFPELDVYSGVYFEVDKGCTAFSPELYKRTWNAIYLDPVGDSNKYTLTLVDLYKEYKILAFPVVDEENYEVSLDIFRSKYKEYVRLRNKRIKEELAGKKAKKDKYLSRLKKDIERDKEMEKLIKQRQKNREEWAKQRKEQERRQQLLNRRQDSITAVQMNITVEQLDSIRTLEREVQRTQNLANRVFSINRFGTWNCDRPKGLPQGAKLLATFYNRENGEKITDHKQVYLVELDKNMIFNLKFSPEITFNPASDNLLWFVTADNRMAIFYPEDFKGADKTAEDFTFKMTIKDREEALEELSEFIKNPVI